MRETTTAGELKVGDTLPLVGRVTELLCRGDDVRITLYFSYTFEVVLSRDHVVWVDRVIHSTHENHDDRTA